MDGITISAGNSTVRGLTINNFGTSTLQFAIALNTKGGDIIEGNFIGTDVTGNIRRLNGYGVFINERANNCIIGGTAAAARNLISGNRNDGVTLGGAQGVMGGNRVQGNFIGTNVNGTSPLGNGFFGVQIYGSSNETVGGTTAGARNSISGNGGEYPPSGSGVYMYLSYATGNLVQGNYIGTGLTGATSLGNKDGVRGENGANHNMIGGTTPGTRNIVSGNSRNGIVLITIGDSVQGNYIGTDVNGTADLGNNENGVLVQYNNNTIGGTSVGARNTISGNGLSGVLIDGGMGNAVQGNFIGTNAAGTAALGNDLNGVTTSQAPNNTIGGPATEARNVISANGRHGVSIGIDTQSGSTGVTVQNNYVGTDVTGNNCVGNLRDGVFVNKGSVSHTIIDNVITC